MNLNQNSGTIVIAANVLAGLMTHSWLKRYDPVPLSRGMLVLTVIPSLIAAFSWSQSAWTISVLDTAKLNAVFYATLSLSVLAYRLSPYHPLAKYPGPVILKVTKLWSVWVAYTGKNHVYFKALHDKYGPTIRIGPNELSTIDKDFISEVLGSTGMPKGPIWDGRRFAQMDTEVPKGYDSLIDVRDPAIHMQLRRPWNKSFSAEPLQNYERLLLPRVMQLNQHLKREVTNAENGIGYINIAQWINYLSFDFMGDIAFGGAFELMRDGDKHHQHRAMGEGMYLPSITQHIPWFADFSRSIPFMSSGLYKLVNLGVQEGVKRANKDLKHKDLFYHMGESAGDSMDGLEMIISNVIVAIVAGSDTSSTVMNNAIQLLLSHPQEYRRLQIEIDDAFNKHQIPDLDAEGEVERYSDVLAGLKYLNGVINEVLRLFPAVPTGLQRAPAKGSGGRLLSGSKNSSIFLPEGNAIVIPPYALHRSPQYFSRPEDFIPERWFSDAFDTPRDAFIPFSFGPNNCVGRPLALMELRYVLATLFRNFDMEFDATKYDRKQWESEVLDRFTLSLGDLNVRMTLRTAEMRTHMGPGLGSG